MATAAVFLKTGGVFPCFANTFRSLIPPVVSCHRILTPTHECTYPLSTAIRSRFYSNGEWKGKGKEKGALDSDNRGKAWSDVPPDVDPICPEPCKRREHVKKGIIHKIKLKILEGGSNFGTPFRMLTGKKSEEAKQLSDKDVEDDEPKRLPAPKKEEVEEPDSRPGVTITILGADTAVGQYVALLLKQSSCIRKIRLYEAQDTATAPCARDLCQVVTDLQHIDTNCTVEGYSCANCDLERCLLNSDIVLMLESGYVSPDMSAEKRFLYQAPIVKRYADAIAGQCPTAFIVCCASPIDCMVPLIAETMKEMNWYDHRKLLGSMAVPEMRASTIAARALSLEPRYTRVPCVGGTEGEALVPLFSRAVEYFEFPPHCVEWLTEAVRQAQSAVCHQDNDGCKRAAELSEAHAVAGLVIKIAHALLCHDITKVTGFVESDPSQVIACSRFSTRECLLSREGICNQLDFPAMTEYEVFLLTLALNEIEKSISASLLHYDSLWSSSCARSGMRKNFYHPVPMQSIEDCKFHADNLNPL